VAKISNAHEEAVYPKLAKNWPREFIPEYFTTYFDEKAQRNRIVIQDLTAGYKHPSIMDIKIGSKTWEKNQNFRKKFAQAKKDLRTTTMWQGCRMISIKTYQSADATYKGMDKDACKKLRDYSAGFTFYLSDGDRVRKDLIPEFEAKLHAILHHFNIQQRYQFIGSSLLFIYEAGPEGTPVKVSSHQYRVKRLGSVT